MLMKYFEIIKSYSLSKARTGIIHTAHGDIKTPAFLPIGTKGAVKSVTSDWYWSTFGGELKLITI